MEVKRQGSKTVHGSNQNLAGLIRGRNNGLDHEQEN
jgi:hypothetical protein